MANSLEHKEAKEIQLVVGSPPHWILKFGMYILGSVVTAIILMASVFNYPDEVETRVIVTSERPAIRLFANENGQVESLLISDGQMVEKDQILAVMESSASYLDVLNLEKKLSPEEWRVGNLNLQDDNEYSIGTLQSTFSQLCQSIDDFEFYKNFHDYDSQRVLLSRQISDLYDLNISLEDQGKILQEQVRLAKIDMDRNDFLFKSGTVSSSEHEKIKINYLQQKRLAANFNSEVISNKIKISQLESRALEIKKVFNEEGRRKSGLMGELRNELLSEIRLWKQRYLVTAPISGKVNLSTVRAAKQFITSNEEFLSIDPNQNKGRMIGQAFLVGQNIGKVKMGMKAIIQIDGYSYHEFGSLIAIVSKISSVPEKEGYFIELQLPGNAITTYNKVIEFKQEMQGTVKIITENRSLGSRLFDRIRSLMNNRI